MRIIGIKIIARVLSWIPLRLVHLAGDALGSLLSWFPSRRRRVAEANIAHCYPQLTDPERKRLLQANLRHYGKAALELGALWHWPQEKLLGRLTIDGLDQFEAALADQRGLIFATPHFGAWELINVFLQQYPDLAVLFKPTGDETFDQLLVSKRARFSGQPLPTNRSGLVKLLQHLKAGGLTGVLPDQEPKAGQGVFSDFFGQPAWTGVLVPSLLKKSRARILFGACVRQPKAQGYRLHFMAPPESIYSAQRETAVAAVNQAVEQCIALAPEQYLWSYKRFRRQPDDSSIY